MFSSASPHLKGASFAHARTHTPMNTQTCRGSLSIPPVFLQGPLLLNILCDGGLCLHHPDLMLTGDGGMSKCVRARARVRLQHVDWLVWGFSSFNSRKSLGYLSNGGRGHSSGLLQAPPVCCLIPGSSALSHGIILVSWLSGGAQMSSAVVCECQQDVCVCVCAVSPTLFLGLGGFHELKEAWRSRKRVDQWEEDGVFVKVAWSSPPPRGYSSSSLCFLLRAGPWPFLREPFWGRRRCPRSCSFHGTPFCPSSLSRSESERMRAEEVGAGMGFSRAVSGQQRRSRSRKPGAAPLLLLRKHIWSNQPI